MAIGRVKWYDKTKGYGFIENPEGDVFFHFSDIIMDGFKALAEDQRVNYRLVRTKEGLKAKDVQPVDKRASVRGAARYRTLIQMKVLTGKEQEFERLLSQPPSWVDELEQDVGLRRVGAWRIGNHAICLIESEKPLPQLLELAKSHNNWLRYEQWRQNMASYLDTPPVVMDPILPTEPPPASPVA